MQTTTPPGGTAPGIGPKSVRQGRGVRGRSIDYARKYWWVGAIAVPIVTAVIQVLPSYLGVAGPPGTYITNMRIGGDMFFFADPGVGDPALSALARRGFEAASGGRYAESKPLLEEVAAKAPSAAVLNNLGVVRAALGETAAAERDYQRALELDPAVASAVHLNLGLLAQAGGNLRAAADHFRQAEDYGEARTLARAIDEQLRNSTILSAAAIQPGAVIESTLAGDSDADYFAFTAPSGPRDLMRVRLENQSTTLAPELKVYNADRVEIGGTRVPTAGANLTYEFGAAPEGRYHLGIKGTVMGAAGTYTLAVAPARAYDRFEPNDEILQAREIGLGQPLEASVLDGQDADYFRFQVSAGTLRVAVANRSATLRPGLHIYDANRNQVAREEARTPGAHGRAEVPVAAAGTWYVQVTGTTVWGGTAGDYTLTVAQ